MSSPKQLDAESVQLADGSADTVLPFVAGSRRPVAPPSSARASCAYVQIEVYELVRHAIRHMRGRHGDTLFHCWMKPADTKLPRRVLVKLGADLTMRFYLCGEVKPLAVVNAAEVAAACGGQRQEAR